jgi:hypothetical protein
MRLLGTLRYTLDVSPISRKQQYSATVGPGGITTFTTVTFILSIISAEHSKVY